MIKINQVIKYSDFHVNMGYNLFSVYIMYNEQYVHSVCMCIANIQAEDCNTCLHETLST